MWVVGRGPAAKRAGHGRGWGEWQRAEGSEQGRHLRELGPGAPSMAKAS